MAEDEILPAERGEMGSERYVRNPDFVYRWIVDEAVLVPVCRRVTDTRCLYTLNEVGAFVWERLDRPTAPAELQAAILDEFDADPRIVAQDLGDYLEGMVGIGAVRRIVPVREA
jgi:hypothetical protein